MTATAAGIEVALKQYYSKEKIESLTYANRPLFALIDKKKDFFGDVYKIPQKLTNPQGRSAVIGSAITNKTSTSYVAFLLERVKDYAIGSISTENMLASQNNAGAFLQLAIAEIDNTIDTLTRSVAMKLYLDGSGTLGVVKTAGVDYSAKTITLASSEDVVHFEVGQKIEVFAPGGTSARAFVDSIKQATIDGVDRDAGVLTFDTFGANHSIVAGDEICVVGDRNLAVSGLAAWLPGTAPSGSDDFFGVDRSVDPSRLAGIRKSYVGVPIEEAVIDMARKIGREGGEPTHLFLSFDKYAALEKSLGTKVMFTSLKVGEVSFQAMQINSPKGVIAVVADQDCPSDRGYMLDLKHWSLYSLGEPVRILDQDGNKWLRESTEDAMQVRVGFYGNVGCRKVGANGVMKF